MAAMAATAAPTRRVSARPLPRPAPPPRPALPAALPRPAVSLSTRSSLVWSAAGPVTLPRRRLSGLNASASGRGERSPPTSNADPPPPSPLRRWLAAAWAALAAWAAVFPLALARRVALIGLVALTASAGAAAGRAGAARLLGGAAAPPAPAAGAPALPSASSAEVPYSRFLALVRAGDVATAAVDGGSGRVSFQLRPRAAGASAKGRRASKGAAAAPASASATPAPGTPVTLTTTRIAGDTSLIPTLVAGGVEFAAASPPPGAAAARLLGQCLALWVPLLPLLWFASRAVGAARGGGAGAGPGVRRDGGRRGRGRGGAGGGADGGSGPPRVTFADVAGADGAKAELAEAVAALKDPGAYAAVGAVAPSGILLYGPPGTGKTLLARAVAGEAGVPFIACSASEFVELYVGRGAARVRALFAQARRAAPCVVFIDELDAVGGRRGAGGSNDERDQTLNQLLTELDGFDGAGRAGVLLLAATNRAAALDPALVRPGRLSRRVAVPLPDAAGRAAILGVHLRRVALAGGPGSRAREADRLAARCAGLSGAQLADCVNDAALLAVRAGRRAVSPQDLDAALERAIHGVDGRGGGAAGGSLARAWKGAVSGLLGQASVPAGGGAPPPAAAG